MMRLMRDHVGATFADRYRLVSRIAGGGMGEVYRAHDMLLDRAVAVKVLQPSLAVDPELVERFRLEAQAAARLTHPNVVGVYDWGSEDERTYYMVMEYVPGTDLRDVLADGPLDPAHATEIVASVCDALQAAHSEGLVHRDVKPENVLISRKGVVKVADFGIAAVQDADRTSPGGHIPGTLQYLAPEQARGDEGTALSDVWAAGAMLFECLTGAPPIEASGRDLLDRRAEEPPVAPSRLVPSVPVELDEIVLRACALNPEVRYGSAAAMAAALRSGAIRVLAPAPPVAHLLRDVTSDVRMPVQNTSVGPRTARRRRKLRVRRLVALLVVMGLVAFGAVKAAGALLGPKEVEVPSLATMTLGEARAAADEAGFEVVVKDERRHPDVPEGAVIEQDPATGLLLQGEEIGLVISLGPPLVRLPDIKGADVNDAKKALVSAGLVVGDVTTAFSVDVDKGSVISSNPSKGKLEEGTEVSLVVSKGPRSLEIPGVLGIKAAKAKARIEEAGFVAVLLDVYSDDVPAGHVVSTSPEGGEMADEGSEIRIAVSIGPEFEEVKLPDVRGMSVDAATAKLKKLGLRVRVVESGGACSGGSTVAETNPLAGSTVRENDIIALFVC